MTRVKLGLVGSAISTLALAACAVATPSLIVVNDNDRLVGSVFRVGYHRISEVYLQQVDLGDITVDGLSGLSTIDADVAATRHGDTIQLVAGGTVIGEFDAPAPRDAHGWADVTLAAIADARAASPTLDAASPEEIYEAVFVAITGDLDDYSRYVNAEHARQERAYRDGYGGIGLLLEYDESGRALVQEVFADGPAFRAGITNGEFIVGVDGEDIIDWTLETLGSRLRGPTGTDVTVTLVDAGGGTRVLRLRRERVIPHVVTSRFEDGIVIVRVSRFNAGTARQLDEAVAAVLDEHGQEARGFILDLRGNPGGLLGQSVSVADRFITRGQIISTRGRHPDSLQYYEADSDDLAHGLPMAVLVDGRSASGAEVVAAAMQDSGRAIIVGTTSFGKGSVQTVTRLPNDGELFLTWSRIYAPSGYTLHRQGVLPTICTSGSVEDPELLIAQFRSGQLDVPATLAPWRLAAPEDEAALTLLRESCPWQRQDEDIDVMVAKRVLTDEALYSQALEASVQPALAAASGSTLARSRDAGSP
ncbi:MAG: S41 family peptidase [Alphaproteobacteria bacterium]